METQESTQGGRIQNVACTRGADFEIHELFDYGRHYQHHPQPVIPHVEEGRHRMDPPQKHHAEDSDNAIQMGQHVLVVEAAYVIDNLSDKPLIQTLLGSKLVVAAGVVFNP